MVPAIGYAIREQNRLFLDDPAINAAEITFERADDPLRVDRYIRDANFDCVSVHEVFKVCFFQNERSLVPQFPTWRNRQRAR